MVNRNVIGLVGNGRMSKAIQELVQTNPQWRIGHVLGAGDDFTNLGDPVDIIIDFSSPSGLLKAINWAKQVGAPLLSGTTGLSIGDQEILRQFSQVQRVHYARNFSEGIQLLIHLLRKQSVLKDWTVEIEEIHHNTKKDQPSGTAIWISEILHRQGWRLGEIRSKRVDQEVGTHKVILRSSFDRLEITHSAFSRESFARGALTAAQTLLNQTEPGLYGENP